MHSLDAFAHEKLAGLEARDLRRTLAPGTRTPGALIQRADRTLVSFACNDYLDLSHHPRVIGAGVEALQRYGAGSGGSRLVTGEHPLLARLEAALAARKETEAALVFGSGFLTNVGVIPALVGEGDLILLDAWSHACMWAGARLSGARVEAFAHNDLVDLERRLTGLRAASRRALIMTERVFSMDGDRAPVVALLDLATRHDAWTLVDDAHGLGVVGPDAQAPLEMGTLSKALGGYGGYVCASRPVIELLKNRARSFVYTTGLPPACAGAALEALAIVAEQPELCARPLARAQRFTARLGLAPAQSAIVPYRAASPAAALALSRALAARGFLVVAIRPPTVPEGTARLRFAFSAAHTEAQVDAAADALAELAPLYAFAA